MGNDEKRPTTAAWPVSGMTMSDRRPLLLRLVIGTSRIAANPPRAAPRAQLTSMAMKFGEMAKEAAATGFSATAEVATPKEVYR